MAENYIETYHTWATAETITAERVNGNISNIIDGLSGGLKAINISKVLIGGTTIIDSSRVISSITSLTVDNININGNTITSSSGDIILAPASYDVIYYSAVNDANPEIRMGAVDAEELHIQSVYDSGAQTLDYILFQTDVASATADKGQFKFNVDGTEIARIDDGGIELVSGMTLTIKGASSDLIITGGVNTFNLTNGTASIDIATAIAVDINANVTVSGALTVTNAFTVGATNGGAIDFGVASKTLTISENCTINQDLQQTATPTFAQITVDNLVVNANTLSSTSGDIVISPVAGSKIDLDSAVEIDSAGWGCKIDANWVFSAYAGKNITIESVTFDGGVVAGISSITATTGYITTVDLGTNTIYDGNMTGNWAMNSGNISGIGTATATSFTDGTATMTAGALSGVTTISASSTITGISFLASAGQVQTTSGYVANGATKDLITSTLSAKRGGILSVGTQKSDAGTLSTTAVYFVGWTDQAGGPTLLASANASGGARGISVSIVDVNTIRYTNNNGTEDFVAMSYFGL